MDLHSYIEDSANEMEMWFGIVEFSVTHSTERCKYFCYPPVVKWTAICEADCKNLCLLAAV